MNLLTVGQSEYIVSLDEQGKDVFLTIEADNLYFSFKTRTDEKQLLRAIVSFLNKDGEVVCKSSESMTIGKFIDANVEIAHDDEYADKTILRVGGKFSFMSMDLNKEELTKACEDALGNL